MNALMCPTDPATTISVPFIEIPHLALASPSITSLPLWPEAPALCDVLPLTRTVPDMMFSATPVPAAGIEGKRALSTCAGHR